MENKSSYLIKLNAITVCYLYRKCFHKIGHRNDTLKQNGWARTLFNAISAQLQGKAEGKEWFDLTDSRISYLNDRYTEAVQLVLSGKYDHEFSVNYRNFLPVLRFAGFDQQYANLQAALSWDPPPFTIVQNSGGELVLQLLTDEKEFDRKIIAGIPYVGQHQPETAGNRDLPVTVEPLLRYQVPLRPFIFFGRSEQIARLHLMLTTDPRRVLLLHGTGGMGKTTLMQEYLHQDSCQHYFHRIIYSTANADLPIAFTMSAAQGLGLSERIKDITRESDQLVFIAREMNKLGGKNLFVIDNINERDFADLLRLKSTFQESGWKFLITSRAAPDGFAVLDVDELGLPDARLLFACNFIPESQKNSEDATSVIRLGQDYLAGKDAAAHLDKLLEHIGLHTLLTELLARAGCKKGLSAGDLLERLKEQDFRHPDLQRLIYPGAHGEGRGRLDQVRLHHYLLDLFETAYLLLPTDDPKVNEENASKATMLRFFSVLPPTEIPLMDLKVLWQVAKAAENAFEDRLDELRQIGWIKGKRADLSYVYKMHQLVQEVVYQKLEPDADNCRPLVRAVTDILSKPQAYPRNYQHYAESIIQYFDPEEDQE